MNAVYTVGLLAVVLGLGLAFGGLLGSWRYGTGLGKTALRVFRAGMRYGLISAVVGFVLIGVAAIGR